MLNSRMQCSNDSIAKKHLPCRLIQNSAFFELNQQAVSARQILRVCRKKAVGAYNNIKWCGSVFSANCSNLLQVFSSWHYECPLLAVVMDYWQWHDTFQLLCGFAVKRNVFLPIAESVYQSQIRPMEVWWGTKRSIGTKFASPEKCARRQAYVHSTKCTDRKMVCDDWAWWKLLELRQAACTRAHFIYMHRKQRHFLRVGQYNCWLSVCRVSALAVGAAVFGSLIALVVDALCRHRCRRSAVAQRCALHIFKLALLFGVCAPHILRVFLLFVPLPHIIWLNWGPIHIIHFNIMKRKNEFICMIHSTTVSVDCVWARFCAKRLQMRPESARRGADLFASQTKICSQLTYHKCWLLRTRYSIFSVEINDAEMMSRDTHTRYTAKRYSDVVIIAWQ